MQSKPKQLYRIGDVVELETPWMEHDLEGNEQEHYWVLTILEIFRNEQVIHTVSFKWLLIHEASFADGLASGFKKALW